VAHLARITYANPSRRRVRKKKESVTMAKRKKRRARKKTTNPKKRVHRRKKRRLSANPRRRHRRAHRARVHNPRRRRRHRAHASNPRRRHRRRASNPHRFSRKRRHRRNPGLPAWAMAGVAALVGLGTYAGVASVNYLVTKMIDPSTVTLNRNRYILSALGVGGGLFLATKKPIFGVAVAAGSLIAAVGSKLTIWLGTQIQSFVDPANVGRVGAVYGNVGQVGGYEGIAGYLPQNGMQAVYGNMGAVYGNIGQAAPAPPWQGNPFAPN
jgi:hypothetical protein